jgi:hypothetical protein
MIPIIIFSDTLPSDVEHEFQLLNEIPSTYSLRGHVTVHAKGQGDWIDSASHYTRFKRLA